MNYRITFYRLWDNGGNGIWDTEDVVMKAEKIPSKYLTPEDSPDRYISLYLEMRSAAFLNPASTFSLAGIYAWTDTEEEPDAV